MTNWLSQIFSVTLYNLRTIPERKGSALAAAVGIAGVVAVFVGVLSIAEGFRARGVKVVAIISRRHSDASKSQRADGRKLQDFADLVLDTVAPVGDAMVKIDGLDTPVAPAVNEHFETSLLKVTV